MSFRPYPSYEDSGVGWLGALPDHWELPRLKRVARLLTEKTDRRSNPVGLENVEGWTGRLIETESDFEGEGVAFDVGDILFGKLRPYLAKVLLAERVGEAVGDFHILRPAKGTDGRFLQLQMMTKVFISIVDGSTFGAKMPRANWDFMGNLPVPLPPLPEQTAIVAFLDRETGKIDALVAEQRRLIALLKEKRQAVISHAVTKGMNQDAPMKPSGIEWLGDVPGHWEVVALSRVTQDRCDGPFGSGLKSEHYTDEGVRVVRLQNIRVGYFDDTDAAFIDADYCRASLHSPLKKSPFTGLHPT